MPLMGCIYCILVYMDVYVPLKGGIEGLCIIKVEYCARIFKYKTFEEQPKKDHTLMQKADTIILHIIYSHHKYN